MKIDWSEAAIRETTVRFGADAKLWKLIFDAEGCGCSVDGVPLLAAVDLFVPGDAQADSNAFEVGYELRHEVFFDEHLRIDYSPERRSFSLSSDGQIYTNRLKLQDNRDTLARRG